MEFVVGQHTVLLGSYVFSFAITLFMALAGNITSGTTLVCYVFESLDYVMYKTGWFYFLGVRQIIITLAIYCVHSLIQILNYRNMHNPAI